MRTVSVALGGVALFMVVLIKAATPVDAHAAQFSASITSTLSTAAATTLASKLNDNANDLKKGVAAFECRNNYQAQKILSVVLDNDNKIRQLSKTDRQVLVLTLMKAYRGMGADNRAMQLLCAETADDPENPWYHYYLASLYAGDRATRQEALKSLRAAYQHRKNLGAGATLPNPKGADDLAPLLATPEFQKLLDDEGIVLTNSLEADVMALAAAGEDTPNALTECIRMEVEQDPACAAALLLRKIKETGTNTHLLVACVWALGLTKDPATVDTIKQVYQQSRAALVKQACQRALATIGGAQAGAFLMTALQSASEEQQIDILNLLGQMQYDAALPLTESILKQDIDKYSLQPVLVFGKMGDKAVPFLLQRINAEDRNTRGNALDLLGQWLIPLEAAKPLQERYWAEQDVAFRIMIFNLLQNVIADPAEIKAVFGKIAAGEKEKKGAAAARAIVNDIEQLKTNITALAQKKLVSATVFQREYDRLYKSAGKKGSYKKLGTSSTAKDEPQLKALRERILQRNSDEAFYDYKKINAIIIENRMIAQMTNTASAKP